MKNAKRIVVYLDPHNTLTPTSGVRNGVNGTPTNESLAVANTTKKSPFSLIDTFLSLFLMMLFGLERFTGISGTKVVFISRRKGITPFIPERYVQEGFITIGMPESKHELADIVGWKEGLLFMAVIKYLGIFSQSETNTITARLEEVKEAIQKGALTILGALKSTVIVFFTLFAGSPKMLAQFASFLVESGLNQFKFWISIQREFVRNAVVTELKTKNGTTFTFVNTLSEWRHYEQIRDLVYLTYGTRVIDFFVSPDGKVIISTNCPEGIAIINVISREVGIVENNLLPALDSEERNVAMWTLENEGRSLVSTNVIDETVSTPNVSCETLLSIVENSITGTIITPATA